MSLTPKEKSFLKWAGGKTRYAATLAAIAPPFTGRYWEPFLGSGALFFELSPVSAVLSDANVELITCFQSVAKDPHAVMNLLDAMPNTPEYFANVRRQETDDLSAEERAARVIYLNKTSFRGLWRVNKRGQFNTPYGAYDRPLYNPDTMLRASKALAGVEILACDFEKSIDRAEQGDWVFLDPPYVPLGGWADFKRYTPEQFGETDHQRLYQAMVRASERGVFVTHTNSETPFVKDLFEGQFNVHRLATRRDINLQSSNRKSWDLVVTNYESEAPAQTSLFDAAAQ
jgi:DNA adenine methylase